MRIWELGREGTPVEQIDIAAPAFKADPYAALRRLREERPVAQVRVGRRRSVWLVTRYEDAVAALKHPLLIKDKFAMLAATGMPLGAWMPGFARPLARNMLDIDDPDHRRLRAIVQPAFNPRLIERMRARVAELTGELLDGLAARGSFDLVADYAMPLPTTIIAEMLGVPVRDRAKFHRWTRTIVLADSSNLAMLTALPSVWSFVRYLRRLIEEKRREPADDLISALVLAKAEGERLDADEVLAMAFLLLVAGHETTVNLIGNGMLALIEHPEALARLREDPEAVKPAVEEMLRYCGPLMTATERYASEELELGDTTIPQGSLVYVSVASANRDQAAFPQADQFLIGREPNRHLAFGHGMHFCLGSSLARLEGQIALGAFASRFPNVRLAVDRSRLRWKGGVTLRGLLSLPLAIR